MDLPKYSMGIGDRFGRQGKAQLAAFIRAKELGVEVTPVWNKSNREHNIIHSQPACVRAAADGAVKSLGWTGPYFVDADHIEMKTVDRFLIPSDFFTIDVADFIGKPAVEADVQAFVASMSEFTGVLRMPGLESTFDATSQRIEFIARKYLCAIQEAGRIFRYIAAARGVGNFIAEVSMDETDQAQTPLELLFILAALASEKVLVRTIAPKFTGRFNKGVDYAGDLAQFEREFQADLAVIAFAVKEFGLPADLKLSVHSGSDKFSLYGPINRAIVKSGAGLHLKTAGTTWLAELTGLAVSGGDGLNIAKKIYTHALGRFGELCGPYATVIDIEQNQLPSANEVSGWSSQQFAAAVNHDQTCPQYNASFRQLLHVGFKIAAEMGEVYLRALEQAEAVIAPIVTQNIFDRHLSKIFLEPRLLRAR